MRRIVADTYLLLSKFTKLDLVSYVLAILIVAILDYFIFQGLLILSDGMLPLKPLDILFTPKFRYFTLIAIALVIFLINANFSKLSSKQSRNPNYSKLLAFALISLLLIAYTQVVSIIG